MTLQSVAGIDMRADPALAKEKIMQSLHPTYLPKRTGKTGDKKGDKTGDKTGDDSKTPGKKP
jgi:hypothetical protein